MEHVVLTNHLYPLDYVISSFTSCLNRSRPLEEALYWLWELTYTLDNVDDGIKCIVALLFPHAPAPLLRFIRCRCSAGMDREDLAERASCLSDIVCNLRSLNKVTFALRMHDAAIDDETRPSTLYISRKGNTSVQRCLAGALKNQRAQDAGFFLRRLRSTPAQPSSIEELWDEPEHRADLIAKSAAAYRSTIDLATPGRVVFSRCPPAIISSLVETFGVIDDNSVPAYKKLPLARKYRVRRDECVDHLCTAEQSNELILETSRSSWFRHASGGIAWSRRVAEHEAVITLVGTATFPTEEGEERFWNKYALDFDELSLQCQKLSLPLPFASSV